MGGGCAIDSGSMDVDVRTFLYDATIGTVATRSTSYIILAYKEKNDITPTHQRLQDKCSNQCQVSMIQWPL